MRNISLIIIVLLLIPDLVLSQTPIFTWKSGSENSNQATSMYVSPGARDNACSWTDANGDLWLFGGEGLDINGSLGLLNDLWKFDASRWRWEKLSGATNIDIKGTYGTLGISSSNNVPGARKGAIAWIDADNNLWLFGGEGIDDNNSKGQLNDLWKYNPITEEWTWIDGSKLRNQEGNYNGLYGTSKIPGGRKSSCAWTDNSGNFWLFGGYGYDKYAYLGFLNDIWKYNTSTNEWTHEKGSTDANLKGNYGTLNVSNLSNTPGSRDNAITWVDANNNFLMYSGYGYDGSSNLGYLNDLWKYNPATKEWVWISGNNQRNVSGVYGVKEVSSTTNLPGSRRNATSWLDNSGNLLIFGGYGYDFEGSLGYLGDLWKYNIVTEEWVWLSGADIVNSTGKYGTLGFGDWNNNAGSREGAVAWKDTNGDYFLFGGKGYDGTQSFGLLNDLWALYDNLKWLWAAGSSSKDEIGFYGKGTINNTYSPGSKEYHMTWADSKNRLWVFGGQTSNLYRYLRRLNDLWYYDIELDTWVWVSGDIIDSQPGNYGIKGVENKTNYPGGRTNSVTWIDSKGNLWLFGGQGNDKDGNYGELNDLWKFNTNTQNWIWVSGSNIINDLGNFGTKGIESPDNLPSSRSYAISWVDSKDNLWLFGGNDFNALWKFNTETGNWTWVSGSKDAKDPGNYSDLGVESPENIPRYRSDAMSWIDSNDNLWLFGGVTGLDDLWKFNTSTGNWTWVSGGYNSGIPINYGVLGIEDPSNFPGRRYGGVSWIDESDNLWFFGGMGYDSDNNIGRLNNLWKYNLSSGNWTWMSGNSKRNMPGIYNVKNIPNSENIPGSRAWASATKDSNNKFWLMSGSGYDINGYLTYLTDLWSIEFIPATPANISHRSIGQYEAEFEWDPTIWTDKYIVEVSNDLAFSDIHSTFENLLSNPNSNTLVIQSLSPGTTYYLRLKSENNLGASAFSEIFTFITAPETPSINEVVNIGQEIATVNWSHEIATDSYNVEVSVDTFKTKSIFSVTVNSLQLEGLLPGTNYQVQIQGLNSFGTSPNSMVYHFETTPPNPVCLSATQISQSNFLANWNNTKGAKSYTIDVSDDNYVSYLTGYEGRVTTNLSEIVIGLSPGLTYQYRVRAINSSDNISDYSNVISVTTIPATPTIDVIDSITQNEASASWNNNIVGMDSIYLDISTDNFDTFVNNYNNKGIIGSPYKISGLYPGQNYQVRLRSGNTSGSSPNSNTFTFITIPENPIIESPTNISQSGFTINWNIVNGSTEYLLDVSNDDFSTYIAGYENKLILGNFEDILNLNPGTSYHCRVRSRNATGISGYSESFLIMPLSPTPVINAIDAVSSISQSGFDMNWPPTNGATGYRVYVSADGFISTLPGYDNLLVNDTLLSVSGLQAGTTYSFKLASENNSGISPTSEIITITTIPGTPFALAGSEETPVSFTANWQTVNGADYYQIDISTAEDFSSFIPGWQDSTVTNTSIGVEGLNEGTKYYYRVRSGNGSGVSPPSNSIAVTTDISLTPLAYNMGNYNTSLTSGGSTNITLDISGGLSPYTAKISYSQLASNEMTIADIPQNTTTGNFEFPVTYDMLDAVGLSFTVEVTDAAGSKKNSNEHTIYTAFGENQYNIPFTRFGGKEEDWTMFSIPFKLNGTGNSVAKLFNETIGQSTDRNWRLVRWNNNNKKYADQSSNIEEGKGYFFNSKKDVGDKIKLGAGQSNEAPFTLSLEKGWNQVGNPYNIPISWEAVRQAGGNPDIGPLMVYTPDGAASFTQGDIINPFEAGFVEAKNAGTVEIHPATAQSGGRFGLNEISNRDINQEEWRVPLSVLSGNKSSNIGAFGMHPEATTSNDRYDQLVVPRFMRYTEIYTRHEEEHYPLFAQDITTTQNTHTWRFTFESNILTGLVTLTWPKDELGPSNAALKLLDEQSGAIIDMRTTGSHTFRPDGAHAFSVFFSRDPNNEFLPDALILGHAWPNPARDKVHFPVVLSGNNELHDIELAIYNLEGKKIKVLADGRYKAGIHQFIWETREGGNSTAGVFIYRLEFKDGKMRPLQKKVVVSP